MIGSINFEDSQLLEEIRKLKPEADSVYQVADDLAVAALFSDIFKNVLCYCPTIEKWLIYNGRSWEKVSKERIEEFAARFTRQLQHYSLDIPSPAGNRSHFQTMAFKLGDRRNRLRFIGDSAGFLLKDLDRFDRKKNCFNVQNVCIDLNRTDPKTGNFRIYDHSFDQYLIKIANVIYRPEADCPLIKQFLKDIFEGDQEKVDYLLELVAVSMLSENPEDSMTLLFGRSGRNGKSVFLDTIRTMFGGEDNFSSYAANLNPESLALRRGHDGSRQSGDLARLRGIRLLISSEPPKNMLFDTALLKGLTGRDRIVSRPAYGKEFVEFKPEFSLFMACNSLPIVNDDIVFTSGRARVIEFNRHYGEDEQDKNLREKLTTEEELSGLLNLLLEHLKRYFDNGQEIPIPASVLEATASYQKENDKIAQFFEENTETDPDEMLSMKEGYAAYRSWSIACGYMPESKKSFKEGLIKRGKYLNYAYINGTTIYNIIPNCRLTWEARKSYLRE